MGFEITVEKIQLAALVPFHLKMRGLRAENPQQTFYLSQLELVPQFSWKKDHLEVGLDLQITKPEALVKMSQEPRPQAAPPQPPAPASPPDIQLPWGLDSWVKVNLAFLMREGRFGWDMTPQQKIQLRNVEISLKKSDLLNLELPLDLKFSSDLQISVPNTQLDWPLKVEARQLFAGPEKLNVQGAEILLGGLQMRLDGVSELFAGTHNWHLRLALDDLQSLKIPPSFLPPGAWQGGFWGEVRAIKQSADAGWEIFSDGKSKGLVGDISFTQDDLKVSGRLKPQIAWKIQLKGTEISAPELLLDLETENLVAEKAGLFKKEASQSFRARLSGYVTKNVLVIKQFETALAQLTVRAAGFLGLKQGLKVDLNFEIPQVALAGLEKNFPALSQQPMKGLVSLKAQVSGDHFKGIEGLNVTANPVVLKGFQTNFNHRDDVKKQYAIGPLTADLSALVKTQGPKLQHATIQGSVDLTKMELAFGETFQKKMNEVMRLSVRFGNSGENITTQGSTLQIGTGELGVAGSVAGFTDPKLNLNFKMSKLPIAQLLMMTGLYKDYPVDGLVSGQTSVQGQYKTALGVQGSDLRTKANLNLQLKSFQLKPPPQQSATPPPESDSSTSYTGDPILPNWLLFKNSQFEVVGQLGQLEYGDTKLSGLSWKLVFNKGQASATAVITKIFGGRLDVRRFQTAMLETNPKVSFLMEGKGLQIKPALGFVQPALQQDLDGEASFRFDMKGEWFQSPRFLQSLHGLYSLDFQKLQIQSLRLEEALNTSLAKLPQLNVSPVKTEPFAGALQAIGTVRSSTYQLNNLNLVSVKGDELQLDGSLNLAGQVDLKGRVSLMKPPLRGDLYTCNADDKGRFVLPVNVAGSWRNPSFAFASNTVEALLKNTLTCQVKKQKQKAEELIKKELNEAQDSLVEDLEKKATDKLKDLFKGN